MPHRHPLVAAFVAVSVGAAVVLVLHSAAPTLPGHTFSWVPAAVSPAASAATGNAVAVPTAAPSAPPAPSADAGLLGGLTVPLGTLLQHLNQDTRNSAVGQYTILQALERGLRDRIEQFLEWVTGRH